MIPLVTIVVVLTSMSPVVKGVKIHQRSGIHPILDTVNHISTGALTVTLKVRRVSR